MMEQWNDIINTALLGTEKRSIKTESLPEELATAVTQLSAASLDREELFLQTASVVHNYRQCGFIPPTVTTSIPVAAEEERRYAAPVAHTVLQDIIETGSDSLLRFWLQNCYNRQWIVQPEAIPLLLDAGAQSKAVRHLVAACCGKRGVWLQQFNPDWKWNTTTGNEEDMWQTGSPSQRKNFLVQLRISEPAGALQLLQQTWPQENAATKVELLEAIATNAGAEDVSWLEELLKEKSSKVKEAALHILKTIPSSTLVQSYQHILQQAVQATTTKGLLGLGSKTVLEFKLPALDPALFKTGIQQVSNQKGVKDEDFILEQLTAHVPPQFWEQHLAMESNKIISLLQKENKATLIHAIGEAAVRFKDKSWLMQVLRVDNSFFHNEIFTLLSQEEAQLYAVRWLEQNDKAGWIIQSLTLVEEEWKPALAHALLQWAAKNPYQTNRGWFNNVAALLPTSLKAEDLESYAPKEEYLRSTWNGISEHILKLVSLKEQTIKAFQQ